MHRRRFLRKAGAVAALGSLSLLAGCSSSCPDSGLPSPDETVSLLDAPTNPWESPPTGRWPLEHGTPGNTGYSPGTLPTANLSVAWRTRLDLPSTDAGGLSTSSPVAADGSVYVAGTRRVHALSLATGAHEWTSARLDPTSGDATWEFEPNTVAPAVASSGQVVVGTEDGVVALHPRDGAPLWEVTSLKNVASPVATGGGIVALGDDTLLSLRPDGTERWKRECTPTTDRTPPAVSEQTVLVPTEAGIRGFDAQTGEELWHPSLRGITRVVATGEDGFVGNYDGLHAFSVSSGAVHWTVDRGSGRAFRSPVVTADTIYTVEQPGEAGAAAFALDRVDGRPSPRWCSSIGSGSVTAATDEQALAILGLGTGPHAAQSIVSFSRSRGAVRWALRGGSHPRDWVTPPALLDGGVIVTTRGGTVAAVGGG